MSSRADDLAALGCAPVAVGFSPADALADLAEYLHWPWPMLSDRERLLYRRLGLPRLPLWQVYSAATLARYARALLRGRRINRPVEDTRQIGGDAIVRNGRVIRLFRPHSPDDRPPVLTLLAAVRSLTGVGEER